MIKKIVLGLIIISVTSFSVSFFYDKPVNAVSYQSITQKEKTISKNNTIKVAIEQFKNTTDIKRIKESIGDDGTTNPNTTKVLAVKEGNGYGYLIGGMDKTDSSGKTTLSLDANSDPNSATMTEIISAVTEYHNSSK